MNHRYVSIQITLTMKTIITDCTDKILSMMLASNVVDKIWFSLESFVAMFTCIWHCLIRKDQFKFQFCRKLPLDGVFQNLNILWKNHKKSQKLQKSQNSPKIPYSSKFTKVHKYYKIHWNHKNHKYSQHLLTPFSVQNCHETNQNWTYLIMNQQYMIFHSSFGCKTSSTGFTYKRSLFFMHHSFMSIQCTWSCSFVPTQFANIRPIKNN